LDKDELINGFGERTAEVLAEDAKGNIIPPPKGKIIVIDGAK